MKRLLLLLLASLCPFALSAAEKANTVLIHPGEVIYVRFSQSGGKIKLVKAAKTPDEAAQVVLTLDPADPAKKNFPLNLKLENKFTSDLIYKAQMRSLTENRKMMATVYPVVAGKMSLIPFPPKVEEVAVFAFELER